METYARIGATSGDVTAKAIPINVFNINADGISDQAHAINGRMIKKEAACRLQETMVTPKMKLQTRLPLMKVASLPQGNRVAQIAHCPPTLPSLSV